MSKFRLFLKFPMGVGAAALSPLKEQGKPMLRFQTAQIPDHTGVRQGKIHLLRLFQTVDGRLYRAGIFRRFRSGVFDKQLPAILFHAKGKIAGIVLRKYAKGSSQLQKPGKILKLP